MDYENGTRIKYCEEICENLKNNNNEDCIVWCTDNNGQISNECDNNIRSKSGYWDVSRNATGKGIKLKILLLNIILLQIIQYTILKITILMN